MNNLLLLLLSTCALLSTVQSALWEGALSTSENFVFIDRFAFAETPTNATEAVWTYLVNASTVTSEIVDQSDVQVDIYYDSDMLDGGWFAVWGNDSMSCEQKRNASARNQVGDPLDSNVTYGVSRSVRIGDSKAPHFWYFAISNCKFNASNESTPRWGIQYRMTAMNPNNDQFGVDQDGLLGMYGTFFAFYLIITVIGVHSIWSLAKLHMLSIAVKGIGAIVLLHTLSTMSDLIHYNSYAGNGVGLYGFLVFADLLDTVAQAFMMIVLIVLAQGWCVTSATIRDPMASRCIAALVGLIYTTLFFWRVLGESRESTLYYYESVPGVLALVLRMFFCAYFVLSLRITWREETNPKTRNFYLTFGGLYFLWFIVLVFIVLIAAATPPVYRARTVETMYTLQNWIATTVLVLLFHPAIANRFFEIGGTRESLMAKSQTNSSYQAL